MAGQTCTWEGCQWTPTPGSRSARLITGLCPRHYTAKRKGNVLRCKFTGCEETLGVYRQRCPEHAGVPDRARRVAAVQKWKQRNPEAFTEQQRRVNLKRHYGITPECYATQLQAQGGVCAICRTDDPKDRWGIFAVDHDHETGAVRGLLCGPCNRALGNMQDDVTRLERAAAYLQRGGVWEHANAAERKVS